MSINTEAAELLHAVADLYKCGALKWVPPYESKFGATALSMMDAIGDVRYERRDRYGISDICFQCLQSMKDESLFLWQQEPGRNTRHVISLLRRAAQRLEEE